MVRLTSTPGYYLSPLEFGAGTERRESYGSRCEKKLKGTFDDEIIKLAGLKALVPEELEKHLMRNSNRLRTFDHARPGNRDVCGGEIGLGVS